MPNPTEISLLNYNFEAKACNELLTAMLNHSDFDYVTVDELRRYSELSQFTFDELRTAVYELSEISLLLSPTIIPSVANAPAVLSEPSLLLMPNSFIASPRTATATVMATATATARVS